MSEDIDHILKTARSVRRNLDFDRPVPPEEILAAVDVAVQAPVSLAGENWRFVVITDPEVKAAVPVHYREILETIFAARGVPMKKTHQALVENLHRIPAMIFVYAIGEPADGVSGHLAYYGSILPAAWSLMLALRARELGTTWTTLLSARSAEIAELLGVPDGVTQTVMLPVAYTKNARMKPAERADATEVTYWNRWDGQLD